VQRRFRITRSIIPNVFTLMNLFSGFNAIVQISAGHYWAAAGFIVLAAVFDMLDGMVARLIKATSELGVELDSLCDAVSFGVAPSFLIYHAYFAQFQAWGVVVSALPALAGVFRLARFNVQLTDFEDKRYFVGMPIPSAALTLLSYVLFYDQAGLIPDRWRTAAFLAVTAILSALMASTIRFFSIPKLSKQGIREYPFRFAFLVFGTIVVIVSKGVLLFPVMVLYILASVIRHTIDRLRRWKELDDEEVAGPFDL